MIDLTSDIDTVGGLAPVEQRGPVVPVSAYGKILYYLQGDQRLPSWLVWLRRHRLVLALVVVVGAAVVVARLIGGAK